MNIPHQTEIEQPLLIFIYLNGGEQYSVKAISTYEPLANYFKLSDSDRSLTRNDVYKDGRTESYWHNQVQYARNRLSESNYLRKSAHGIWQLSRLGIGHARSVLQRRPYLNELKLKI